MDKFNVIMYDPNMKEFVPYNIIPYFIDCYQNSKNKPITKEQFKEFIKSESEYRFQFRCEYEIILADWPNQQIERKVDVYDQIIMNLDVITDVLMFNINQKWK